MIQRNFVKTLYERCNAKADNSFIQIVLGPRQVGKTTGVLQLVKRLPKIQTYYATADDMIGDHRSWLDEQIQHVISMEAENKVLIIDEIQKLDNWSEIVKKHWDRNKVTDNPYRLILLGSSSLSLVKGLTESLAGRFQLIKVNHWSFTESCKLVDIDVDEFLKRGGYPGSYSLMGDQKEFYSYIKNSIIESAIEKDILRAVNIKKPSLFRQTFEILSCYPAQILSYTKLLGQLQDKGNTDLVKNYTYYLEQAFLVKALEKFSNQGFKAKSSSPKIILLAPVFHSTISRQYSEEFIFESYVGSRLCEVADSIYYWKYKQFEVDYIVRFNSRLYAIEVKSGRKKSGRGLQEFIKVYPEAIPVFVTRENFKKFDNNPEEFLNLINSNIGK